MVVCHEGKNNILRGTECGSESKEGCLNHAQLNANLKEFKRVDDATKPRCEINIVWHMQKNKND